MLFSYLIICCIGSVAVQTAAGAESEAPLVTIPIDIIHKIALCSPNSNLLFFVPLPKDDIRALIHDRHCARRLLLDVNVPVIYLHSRIYQIVELFTSGKPINWLLPDLTIQNALVLYDRLLSSSYSKEVKVKLASLLVTHIDIFHNVVSAPDDTELSLELLPHLPDLNLLSRPEGIPDEILQILNEVIDHLPPIDIDHQIAMVRSQYPPPFNRIYPRNVEVAAELLTRLSDGLRHQLLEPGVLQSLLRYGLRFEEHESFPKIEDLDQISLIYPLLRTNRYFVTSEHFSMFIGYRNQLQHALTLLRVPAFVLRIRRYPSSFVSVLGVLLSQSCHELVLAVIEQPFFTDLITQPSREDIPIFGYAFSYQSFVIIEALLSRPDFRVTANLCSVFRYMLNAETEHLDRLFELFVTQPIMVQLIGIGGSNFVLFRNLIAEHVIASHNAELLRNILDVVPNAADVVNFDVKEGMKLLDCAFKYEAFNCATVILNVPGIELVPRDRLFPSPLYMTLYNGCPGQKFLNWLKVAPISTLIEHHAEVFIMILNHIRSKRNSLIAQQIYQLPFLSNILDHVAHLQGRPLPKNWFEKLKWRRIRRSALCPQMIQLLEAHIRLAVFSRSPDLLRLSLKLHPAPAKFVKRRDSQGQTLMHFAVEQETLQCLDVLLRKVQLWHVPYEVIVWHRRRFCDNNH